MAQNSVGIKSKVAGILVLAGIVIAVCLVVAARPGKTEVADSGPMGFRFVGVLPYGGDELLDGGGKKIGTFLNPGIERTVFGSGDEQLRDFLFEFPRPSEPVTFVPAGQICIAGTDTRVGDAQLDRIAADPCTGNIQILFRGDIDETYNYRFLFGFLRWKREVRRADLTFQYLTRARNECLFSFAGPLEKGKTIAADLLPQYKMTVTECSPYGNDTSFQPILEFDMDVPIMLGPEIVIVAFDAEDNRYLCMKERVSSAEERTVMHLSLKGGNPAAITAIAAEKPYSVTVRNCLVGYGDRGAPQYQPVAAEIARRLDMNLAKPADIANYRFEDWQTALKIADVARFRNLREQVRNLLCLGYSGFDAQKLDEESRRRLRETAAEFAGSGFMRCYGLQLGLAGGFSEFIDPALEYVRDWQSLEKNFWRGCLGDRNDVMTLVRSMWQFKNLGREQIDTVNDMLLTTNDAEMFDLLFRCLAVDESAYSLEIVKKLARDERPWIYLRAIDCWRSSDPELLRRYEHLDDDTRLRLATTVESEQQYDPIFQQKAYESIGDLLTWEFVAMDSSRVCRLVELMSRKVDRKKAAEACVTLLERILEAHEKEPDAGMYSSRVGGVLSIIARNMSTWYGEDFADIADTLAKYEAEIIPYPQHQYELMRRIVERYRRNQNLEPDAVTFSGRCVDMAGNPIQSVRLLLFRDEHNADERGHVTSRRVLLESAFSDANGMFVFSKVSRDPYYHLDVEAEGFMPREHLNIRQSPAGAYIFEGGNTIEMRRGAAVSGVVYDSNGKPLRDAQVDIFRSRQYSLSTDRPSAKTDESGRFNFSRLCAGLQIVTYVKREQTPENRPARFYGGMFAFAVIDVREREDISNVILDLSKSDSQLDVCILDPDGNPVRGARTSLFVPLEDSYYPLSLDCAGIDEGGHYLFEGLPAGNFQIAVYTEEFAGVPPADITLERAKGCSGNKVRTLEQIRSA